MRMYSDNCRPSTKHCRWPRTHSQSRSPLCHGGNPGGRATGGNDVRRIGTAISQEFRITRDRGTQGRNHAQHDNQRPRMRDERRCSDRCWKQRVRGTGLSFCSKSCKAKFDADPASYLKTTDQPRQTCSYCAGASLSKSTMPGGMALEPMIPSAPATKSEYVCPMHPEIVRDGPGSCPICGMALEPRMVAAIEEENPNSCNDMPLGLSQRGTDSAPLSTQYGGTDSWKSPRPTHSNAVDAMVAACFGNSRSCIGEDGHFSCAAGGQSSTAAPTCSHSLPSVQV